MSVLSKVDPPPSTHWPPHHAMSLTTLRKSSAPFLPPPLLRLIHAVDTYVHLHKASINAVTGTHIEEPSMTVLSSILMAYLIWRFVKGVAWIFSNKRSTAHLGEESVLGNLGGDGTGVKGGNASSDAIVFDETVVICGGMGSGKTALLHRLCHEKEGWELPLTVTSIVANVCYLPTANDSRKGNAGPVRIIDYPGRPSLASEFTQLLLAATTSRLVFTIDATQPITDAVSFLYHSILTHPTVRKSLQQQSRKLKILVASTKSDIKGSKNYKRIKIQLRNELDRLRKVDSVIRDKTENGDGDDDWTLKGKNLDLDDLGDDIPISLYFVEVGLGVEKDSHGLVAVRDFVLNGVVPNHDK
ncbi:hypothetical protein HJC23_003162 [Cyclotella cryptica]|uniref:Signal recognition particle receptor subunit beta n=1 Tax=Cyclotella cryptica TaxID=29204 RepID=A0ABD3PNL5_9STRA